MARSPNYPAHGLSEAVMFVKLVYDKEKKTQVAGEDVAKALGYSSLSGNARSKMASMKKYDLLDGDENKGMRVSDLAVNILYPASDAAALDSKRTAALSPELFKYLYEEKREGSDESIKNYLVSKLDFTPSGAAQAVVAFRDTLVFAELAGNSYNASSTPDKTEASTMQPETRSASQNNENKGGEFFAGIFGKESVSRRYPFDISIPRSLKAELMISGEFKEEDLERLRTQVGRLIDNLKEAFAD